MFMMIPWSEHSEINVTDDGWTDEQTNRRTDRRTAWTQLKLECGTWYHHPRRLQRVWSRNLRIFKVATWHNRCRHNLKKNCIWDNLQCCLLVPRSPSKPVMLTFDLQSRIGIYWRDIALAICSRSQPFLNMNIERIFEATLWHHRWRHDHKKLFLA